MKQIAFFLTITLSFATHAVDATGLFREPAGIPAAITPPTVTVPSSVQNAVPVKALAGKVSMVMRLRHESPKVNGVTRVDHGTGALVDGLILTARHVVEGPGKSLCEVNSKWIPCRIIAQDSDIDIAVLEPLEPISAPAYTLVDGCHSSVKGMPIAVLPARKVSTLWMNINGFHHGASGSPVIQDGRVVAVAVAMRSEIESDSVQIVPAVLVQEVWNEARKNTSVASVR